MQPEKKKEKLKNYLYFLFGVIVGPLVSWIYPIINEFVISLFQ
jgi:hypothetical protein